jgi:hypothetical protein
LFRRGDTAYRRSQRATEVEIDPSPDAIRLAASISAAGDDHKVRERISQQLMDELNAILRLPACKVVVADRAQVHDHDGQRLQSKTYGYYRCEFKDGGVTKARIRIYHRTAVRQQVISPKVYLNTLLHEWSHHYDFAYLKMTRSPHTTGFYKRLRNLAERLRVGYVLPPDPDDPTPVAPPPPPAVESAPAAGVPVTSMSPEELEAIRPAFLSQGPKT